MLHHNLGRAVIRTRRKCAESKFALNGRLNGLTVSAETSLSYWTFIPFVQLSSSEGFSEKRESVIFSEIIRVFRDSL